MITMARQTVHFDELQDEDLNVDIANFLEICRLFKIIGVWDDEIRLKLFPFQLNGKAKQWLSFLRAQS